MSQIYYHKYNMLKIILKYQNIYIMIQILYLTKIIQLHYIKLKMVKFLISNGIIINRKEVHLLLAISYYIILFKTF